MEFDEPQDKNSQNTPGQRSARPSKVGTREGDNSIVSTHSVGRLNKKNHLELLLQKANSIGGIRKLNMQFKAERRDGKVKALDGYRIRDQYWKICEDFLELMELKRRENLQQLSNTNDLATLLENVRTEVDYDLHNLIGLGKRMPIPPELTNERAHKLKKAIYDRVVEVYGDNNEERLDNEKLLKVATCVAEDEFYEETKIESE